MLQPQSGKGWMAEMGRFVSRQPNGRLCLFSTIVDTVVRHNMTDEEFVRMQMEEAREKAEHLIQKGLKPFSMVQENFVPGEMTQKEFDTIMDEMTRPVNEP